MNIQVILVCFAIFAGIIECTTTKKKSKTTTLRKKITTKKICSGKTCTTKKAKKTTKILRSTQTTPVDEPLYDFYLSAPLKTVPNQNDDRECIISFENNKDCPQCSCTTAFSKYVNQSLVGKFSDYGHYSMGCGKLYFFSLEKLTWKEAAENCCKRGMHLLQLSDIHEQKCFNKLLKEHYNRILSETQSSAYEDMWIGMTDLTTEGNDTWCDNAREVVFKEDAGIMKHYYLNKYDSNKQELDCYRLKNYQTNTQIRHENCIRNFPFLCRGILESVFPLTCPWNNVAINEIKSRNLKAVVESMRNENKSSLKTSISPPVYSICNHTYAILFEAATWSEAFRWCQKLNMTLLNVESKKKLICLQNGLKDESSTYWTSGTNVGTGDPNTFGWCSTHKLFNTSHKMWAPEYPDVSLANKCVAVFFDELDPQLNGLLDMPCGTSLPIICQFD